MTTTTHTPRIRIDHAAALHGCTRQTMASYIRAGCPAHDEESAREWIMQHRLQVELARFKAKGPKP